MTESININSNRFNLPGMPSSLNKVDWDKIKSELGRNDYDSVKSGGKYSETSIGRALSGSVLDNSYLQKGLDKIFGTTVKETENFVQISGAKTLKPNKFSEEQLKVLKDNGFSEDVLKDLKTNGKAKLDYGTLDDLAAKTGSKDAVKELAKASGTKFEEVVSKEIVVGKSAFAESTTQKALNLGNSIAKKLGKNAMSEEAVISMSNKAGISVGKLGGLTAKSCKKIPVVGALLAAAFEIPEIISVTKEEGIGGGLKQVGRSGCSIGGGLAGAEVGAAIGTLICPGVGTVIGGLVGYAAGEFAGGKIGNLAFGKRKSETAATSTEISNGLVDASLESYITSTSYENPYSSMA